jgi:hypothetical protein
MYIFLVVLSVLMNLCAFNFCMTKSFLYPSESEDVEKLELDHVWLRSFCNRK